MQEGKAAAHIRSLWPYSHWQSQVRGGRSEQEVLQELGDPHLIAKTLIDTDDGSTQEDYGEYSSYGSSYGNETELPYQQEKRWKKVIDLSTWHGRAVVIAAAAVIIVLLILIIGVAIPFFIILAIILYFLSWLKKKKWSMKICAGFQKRNPAQNLKNLKWKRSCFTILIPLEYL